MSRLDPWRNIMWQLKGSFTATILIFQYSARYVKAWTLLTVLSDYADISINSLITPFTNKRCTEWGIKLHL